MRKYVQSGLAINLLAIVFLLCTSLHLSANTDAEVIGKVTKLEGSAYAMSEPGTKRALTIGGSIYEKDKVFTEDDSLVTILFNDKTRFELGPNANLVASEYNYQQTEEDSVSISVLKGAFRFVTGLVAKSKPESMEVGTAVATIGIRGTHVIGEADATSATIILLEPEDSSRKSAIDVYNSFGKVSIDEPGFGTDIPDEFSPPSPPRRMAMQAINNLMRSMQQINRINMPRPRPGMP
jgi:hypothetical protein